MLAALRASAFRRHYRHAPEKYRAAPRLPRCLQAAVPESESDQTLHAMHDEMERARTRLQLPGVEKPFYLEYRLLDLDVRTVTASFGALFPPPPRATAS